MGVFEQFPYTNFHELNLDYVLSKIKSLNTELESLQKVVENFVSAAPTLAGKNILFFGDSWTIGVGASDPKTEKFSTLLASSLGMHEINYGVGASGYLRPLKFVDQVDRAIAELDDETKNNTALIVIVGGVNDLRNVDTELFTDVAAELDIIINKLHSDFPAATMCFGINMIPVAVRSKQRNWINELHRRMRANTTNRKVIVLDTLPYQFMGRPEIFAVDNLHPNTYGHSLIAGFIKNAILGGTNDMLGHYVARPELTREGYDYASDAGGHIFVENGKVLIEECHLTCPEESGHLEVGSVPEGCRPSDNYYFPIFSGDTGLIGCGAITPAGTLYLNQQFSTAEHIRIPCLQYNAHN